MKGGLGFVFVVIGLVLLWVVVTGRVANFSAAWASLQGHPSTGVSGTGAPAGGPSWGSVFQKHLPWNVPTLPGH